MTTALKIFIKNKIAGDCGAGDFFYASAFSNECEKNLAGEYIFSFILFIKHNILNQPFHKLSTDLNRI